MKKNVTLSLIMGGMLLVGTSTICADHHHREEIKKLKEDIQYVQKENKELKVSNERLEKAKKAAEDAWGIKTGVVLGSALVAVAWVITAYRNNSSGNKI